jgi:predicted nuclease with TOPRIM domain
MLEELQSRLEVLKKEFAMGQARLQGVEFQQGKLRETLLRISGAIQVLEELLAERQPIQENTKPHETFTTSVIHH